MADDNDDERLLRSVRRRNLIKSIPPLSAFLASYALLIWWTSRTFHVPAGDVADGFLIIILIITSIVMPSFGMDWQANAGETQRVRRLQKAHFDKFQSRLRPFLLLFIFYVLALQLLNLYFESIHIGIKSGSNLILTVLPLTFANSAWKLPSDMGEFEKLQYLTATQRAWAISVIFATASLILDDYWNGHLRTLITISLLAGLFTQQWGLFIIKRQAMPPED